MLNRDTRTIPDRAGADRSSAATARLPTYGAKTVKILLAALVALGTTLVNIVQLALTGLLIMLATLTTAGVASARTGANPVQYQGQNMPCPGPDVWTSGNGWYVAQCAQGTEPGRYPMYVSRDLIHWTYRASWFGPGYGTYPSFIATPTRGRFPYWRPNVYFVGGQWINLFSARLKRSGKLVIVEAWTTNLFRGAEGATVLYNAPHASGSIDPTLAPDPQHSGDYIMAWMNFPAHIMIAGLSMQGGLHIYTNPRQISEPTLRWEGGWEEGPILWNHDGITNLFIDANSTWSGNPTNSYAVVLEQSTNPLHGSWWKQPTQMLESGNSLDSPGMGAQPFQEYNGQWMIAFHVVCQGTRPTWIRRYLAFAPLLFNGNKPYVQGSIPPLTLLA